MAYIDRVKSGNKTFYYLGKTIRIGPDKWKKLRIKLGTEPPTKAVIATKLKELKLEEYNVYNKDLIDVDKLEVVDDFKEVYQKRRKKLSKLVVEKEDIDFVIRFTYNSNAIEGNRLTLRETFLIIKEKQIPSGVPARDYNEAVNGKQMLDYLENYKGKLTIHFIEEINKIITKNTGVLYSGRIRFFDVTIEGADFKPPHYTKVKDFLEKMVKFYESNKKKLHPFVLACLIHMQFVEIHPFEDGNGRTGRALMNWVLMKAGYPRLFIPVSQMQTYYGSIDLHNEKKYKESCNKMFEIVLNQLNVKLSTKK